MALLSMQQASLRFGGLVALDDVTFDVDDGVIAGLIGPNGAGKTSALNAITRLYKLDSGNVLFDGRSLLRVRPSSVIGRGIARTFQNVELFPRMTALENVLVGAHTVSRFKSERAMRDRASDALHKAGVESVANRPVAGLPFGTLKKIELARALVSKPRLLLLDEPAGGLAHEEVEQLAETIVRLRDELSLTIVLVEHNMRLVMKISDRVHVLEFGRLIASGSPAEIQVDAAVVAAYLGSARP
jgi:branched-chain amino acid transport system ATP-binding protein